MKDDVDERAALVKRIGRFIEGFTGISVFFATIGAWVWFLGSYPQYAWLLLIPGIPAYYVAFMQEDGEN